VFTTHEQLAGSEEREAELAAAVQEAKQDAAAARRALAGNQTAAGPSAQVSLHKLPGDPSWDSYGCLHPYVP